jgi:hypothetical protein
MSKNDTREQLEKKINLLKRAKKHVRGGLTGICYGLLSSYKRNDRDEAHALKNYIMRSLDGHTWLTGWLSANGFDTSEKYVIKARRDWIDWMIQCLQEDLATFRLPEAKGPRDARPFPTRQ